MIKTVFASKLKEGDLIVDPTGNYKECGPIKRVYRAGQFRVIVETNSGVELNFLPFSRLEIMR